MRGTLGGGHSESLAGRFRRLPGHSESAGGGAIPKTISPCHLDSQFNLKKATALSLPQVSMSFEPLLMYAGPQRDSGVSVAQRSLG